MRAAPRRTPASKTESYDLQTPEYGDDPEKSFRNAYKMLTFFYPRPANGILVAITVMNATLASRGRFAM